MSKADRESQRRDAEERMREILRAQTKVEIGTAEWNALLADYDEAHQQLWDATKRARPKIGWYPVRGMPGFVGGECDRCGCDVVVRTELAPVPYPNGFMPAGVCSSCEAKGLMASSSGYTPSVYLSALTPSRSTSEVAE